MAGEQVYDSGMIKKTFKREVAVASLLLFFGIAIFHPNGLEIAEIIKWPVFPL